MKAQTLLGEQQWKYIFSYPNNAFKKHCSETFLIWYKIGDNLRNKIDVFLSVSNY